MPFRQGKEGRETVAAAKWVEYDSEWSERSHIPIGTGYSSSAGYSKMQIFETYSTFASHAENADCKLISSRNFVAWKASRTYCPC